MHVEKEGQARGEVEDVHAPLDGLPYVPGAVGKGVRQLLDCGGAGFPDVVTANGHRVPPWGVLSAELHRVYNQLDAFVHWKEPLLLGYVLLEDVILGRASELVQGDAPLLCHREVHGKHDGGGGVDRHGYRDIAD